MEIAWFRDPESFDARRVGGKAASLGHLASGSRVPQAFSITTELFDRWAAALRGSEIVTAAELPGPLTETVAST